jgi:hypothetical protein
MGAVMKKYKFYSDSMHGWLAVKTKELYDLKIEKEITAWSYQKGATTYLEEDYDAGVFLKAKEMKGEPVETVTKYAGDRAAIRSYSSYPSVKKFAYQ